MKKITNEDIEKVLAEFYRANVGVQNFESLKKFFENLEDAN